MIRLIKGAKKWLKEEKKLKRKRKLKKLRKEEEDSLVFFFFNKLRFSWRLRGKRFFLYALGNFVSVTYCFVWSNFCFVRNCFSSLFI